MLKKLATTVLLVTVVVGSAFADAKNGGIARQIAMGGSQAGSGLVLNPFIMDDPALVLLNPAYQAMYKDYAWMNLGGGTLTGLSTADNGYGSQNAGLAFSCGKEWSFGAIMSYDPSGANVVNTLISGASVGLPGWGITQRAPQNIPGIANVWEALGSYHTGSLNLGFAFMYGHSISDSTFNPSTGTSGEFEASSSVFGFRAGAIVDLGSGSSFDVSAALRLDKATDNVTSNAGSGGEYSASGTEIQVQARGKFRMSNKVNFVPYALFATLSAEPKEDAFPTGGTAQTLSNKLSALAYSVGVGGEYHTPSFYLAGGLSYQSARAKAEVGNNPGAGQNQTYTATLVGLPVFNVGGEWWFTDWLAGRGGYYRSLANVKFKYEQSVPGAGFTGESNRTFPNSFLFIGGITSANNDGLVTLGLGFRFGGFALDATVSEEALRRGLGLIGSQDNINTFGYITTSYNFE
jgi:hypothetical protein